MAPPPNSLAMATASVQRLVKEEASYHKELESQQKRLEKMEAEAAAAGQGDDEEGNREFILKQERQSVEETKRVLPTLKTKISEAVSHLDRLVVEEGEKGMDSDVSQINAAKDAISQAKSAVREIA